MELWYWYLWLAGLLLFVLLVFFQWLGTSEEWKRRGASEQGVAWRPLCMEPRTEQTGGVGGGAQFRQVITWSRRKQNKPIYKQDKGSGNEGG
jgi:hypothetical protein